MNKQIFKFPVIDESERTPLITHLLEIIPLVSQRFIEQIQLVSHIVGLHFAVVFRNYLI